VIDLRSDTVTTPTPAMRDAMRDAAVGNAAWGEDPTVNALEAASAEAVGKEAAMFVVSGTMANQLAVRTFAARKLTPQIILDRRSHLFQNEAGGLGAFAGVQTLALESDRGALRPAEVAQALEESGRLKAETALVACENTHNHHGGRAVPVENLAAVAKLAHEHGVPAYLDGARLFNAAVALGVDARAIAQPFDAVMFCFSKGLSAPMGSVLCGSAAFIADARRVRQSIGGALRQAGVVAAPALLSLRTMRARLAEDHARAGRLAKGLAGVEGVKLVYPAETNIVVVDVAALGGAAEVAAALAKEGVRADVRNARELRLVTHREIGDLEVEAALAAFGRVAAAAQRAG